MKILSVKQIQAIEKSANGNGLSFEQMMHHAGKGIADWVIGNISVERGVIGLVGSGNNGGDTLIALTLLSQKGIRTIAFLAKKRKNDPLIDDYLVYGGEVIDISSNQHFDYLESTWIPGVIVLDGILGTGLKLPLRGKLLDVMTSIHELAENRPEALIIAVDCPSGVDCDSGKVSEVTLSARHTLCMAAVKQGLLKHPARSYVGELHPIEIGINRFMEKASLDFPEMIDDSFIRDQLPERPDAGHKGTFGTCLVIAGSESYTGAAYLAGKAAYLSGCGLVRLATHGSVRQSLAGELVEAVWTVLPTKDGFYDPKGCELLKDDLKKADALIVGPGWGLSDTNAAFLIKLLKLIPNNLPTLFDADGLKLLSQIENWSALLPENAVLTPHPGEMAILTGLDINTIQSNRWEIAKEFAHRWDVNLILKGAMTVVATPANALYINPISDSALATAGSGDVLSGIIGGLLAQHVPISKAASVGVWLHAQAGVVARRKFGTDVSVTAKDILDNLFLNFRGF